MIEAQGKGQRDTVSPFTQHLALVGPFERFTVSGLSRNFTHLLLDQRMLVQVVQEIALAPPTIIVGRRGEQL